MRASLPRGWAPGSEPPGPSADRERSDALEVPPSKPTRACQAPPLTLRCSRPSHLAAGCSAQANQIPPPTPSLLLSNNQHVNAARSPRPGLEGCCKRDTCAFAKAGAPLPTFFQEHQLEQGVPGCWTLWDNGWVGGGVIKTLKVFCSTLLFNR